MFWNPQKHRRRTEPLLQIFPQIFSTGFFFHLVSGNFFFHLVIFFTSGKTEISAKYSMFRDIFFQIVSKLDLKQKIQLCKFVDISIRTSNLSLFFLYLIFFGRGGGGVPAALQPNKLLVKSLGQISLGQK